LYVSVLIFTILPFCPSVLWAQYISFYGTWRYIGIVCGVWSFIGFVLTLVFYFPPPRAISVGLTRREVISRIDFVGGFLSIVGLLLFMAGIQWGGYQYGWGTSHVLAPLIIGIFLFIVFIIYEWKFAKFPMFPRTMAREPRILLLTLIITFISGANFFSVILFWPTQSYNSYGHNAREVGIRNLALGFPILAGACIILVLLSLTKGKIRLLMFISCCFMTAGSGGLAALNLDNLWASYLLLVISGLGIGGIVVPASIITAIICPDEMIATVTALTLSIRVLGGAIGYSIYYNVFSSHFKENAKFYIGGTCLQLGITDITEIESIIQLTAAGLLPAIRKLPGVDTDQTYDTIVLAGQLAYIRSYPWVYYVSIAFGGVSIICSLFLGNIQKYMDDHIAVHYGESPAYSAEHVVHEKDTKVVHHPDPVQPETAAAA